MSEIDWSKARRRGPLPPGTRIGVYEDTETAKYQQGVDKIMHLLGINAYLVTDGSSLSDFDPDKTALHSLGKALGRIPSAGERIWALAKELEEK